MKHAAVALLMLLIVVIALACGLLALVESENRGGVSRLQAEMDNQRASDAMRKAMKGLARDLETMTPAERAERSTRAFDNLAKNTNGRHAKIAKVMAACAKELNEKVTAFEALTSSQEVGKIYDFASVTDPAAIDERRELLKKVISESEKLEAYALQEETHYRKALAAAGITVEGLDLAFAEGRKSTAKNLALHSRMRQAKREVFEVSLQMLDLLHDEWGEWTAAGDDPPAFASEKAAEAYSGLAKKLGAALTEQEKASKACVQAAKDLFK